MNLGGSTFVTFAMLFGLCLAPFAEAQQQSQNNARELTPLEAARLAQMGGQAPVRPVQPFQLSPEEEQYVVRVLDHWQTQSEGIKLYQCTFNRYVYDTALTNHRDEKTGQLSADSVAIGEIRYGKPG